MSTVARVIEATPRQVWAVLSDGWLYPTWVVGASRMRDVDEHWPQPGAQLHHSVGVWPALISDPTEVLESIKHERLELRTHGWPIGAAKVLMTLLDQDDGRTEVVMDEYPTAGPARLVPRPVMDAGITWRNTETLRRLAFIAEHRAID